MRRDFLIGSTVSLLDSPTLAVVVCDPDCPGDMVAVFEMSDDGDGRTRWVRPEHLKLCTCSIPGTGHSPCETHGLPN